MGAGPLIVTYPLTGRSRAIVEEELGGTAEVIYLVDLAPAARPHFPRHPVAVAAARYVATVTASAFAASATVEQHRANNLL